jgi:N-acetylglutamate synthase-like GNAT family acetyltransferase
MNESLTVHLRVFQQSDLSAVHNLIHHTIDACYSGVYPPRAVQFFKKFHSQSEIQERSRDGDTVVVERAGEIVATGAVIVSEVTGVFVRPDCQHQGLGKTIMCELERLAIQSGHDEATLSVSLPSRAFYEGLGYRILEDLSIDVGEGQHLDFWKARKKLMMEESQQPDGAVTQESARGADSLEAHPSTLCNQEEKND